ncbi:hypothetical protein CAEBREN_15626 [Caenorhabditis brenneri]|uniref:Uncharacterized protein n=1 Tax=Caenorhabditis brenneri TaxID=135651 RepID=G0NJE7_CAEBE|nr:hypothetical protein CAEBREN_15626 [Caenorhabditis brenneri]
MSNETTRLEDWIKQDTIHRLDDGDIEKDAVHVLTKTTKEAQGAFRGTVSTVTLLVELSSVITTHPLGWNAFGECVHQLINEHNPFQNRTTYLSTSIESTGRDQQQLGSFFGNVSNIIPENLVISVSRRRKIEEPRLIIQLTYIAQ